MRKMSYYSPTEAESTDKPYGAFKNETTPGSQDGTQAVAEHMQDPYYAIYQVMQLAGIEPNDILEDGNTNKQFLSALSNVAPILHNTTTTYKKNVIAMNPSSGKIEFYKSLKDDNTDILSNGESWLKIFTINEDGSIQFEQELKDTNLENVIKRLDGLYEGVDLTVKHAEEINSQHSGDPWAWIHSRIQAQNFDGIHIGDYIPMKLSGGTIGGSIVIPANQEHKMQVAGIDTYYNSGDTPIPHHIDFLSLETIGVNSAWNDDNTNNGTAAEPNPWKSSKIYAICNGVNNYTTAAQGNLKHGMNCSSGGIYQMIPEQARNHIIQKRVYVEEQYNATAQTAQPTGRKWTDGGYVFIPHEVEVCGYQANSYNRSEASNTDNSTRNLTKMYPLFRQQTRVKLAAGTQTVSSYWLCCPSGNASQVCNVNGYGCMHQSIAKGEGCSFCFGFRVS